MLYPANTPKPFEIFDPKPQKVVVKDDPKAIGLQVQNGTGKTKSDFHMIFQGDVRGGKAGVGRADGNGAIKPPGIPWGKVTTTFNPLSNETMVCWDAPADPVRPGDFIIFRYAGVKSGLRFLPGYWTPTADPPAEEDKIPTKSASLGVPTENVVVVRQIVRGPDLGGWGYPWVGQTGFAALDTPIALEDLDFSNAVLLTAASNRLGNSFLLPSAPTEMTISIPTLPGDAEHNLVFISQGQSPQSPNRTLTFEVFSLPAIPRTPLRIQVQRLGNELEFLWSSGETLQAVDALGTSWQNVPGNPPGSYLVRLDEKPAQYFRVGR